MPANKSKFQAFSLNNCSLVKDIKKLFKAEEDSRASEKADAAMPTLPINFIPTKYVKVSSRADIRKITKIVPSTGKKYSPTPAGNSLIKALTSSLSSSVTQSFIIYPQPDKNAVSISINNASAIRSPILLPPSENNIYKLEISEKNIKGVARIIYLFVRLKLSFMKPNINSPFYSLY